MSSPLGEPRVPDLWYDLYARVIPGSIFVAVFRCWILGLPFETTAGGLLVVIALGYAAGMFMQPVGSWLADVVERRCDPANSVDETQRKLGRTTRQAMVLSKMHGEVSLFCQSAAFGVVLVITYVGVWCARPSDLDWHPASPAKPLTVVLLLGILWSVAAAFNVAIRRVKRARRYARG